jgi:DNA-binding PadR family transcriptional regulator
MESFLTMRGALLQALLEGPGYGVTLAGRIDQATLGQVRLGEGNLYSVLRSLAGATLVRSWPVTPGGHRGARTRLYYELTGRGIEVATAQRTALAGLVGARASAPTTDPALAAQRLRRCAELSADVLSLRDRLRKALP